MLSRYSLLCDETTRLNSSISDGMHRDWRSTCRSASFRCYTILNSSRRVLSINE